MSTASTGSATRVLVTGAAGYIGGRLIPELGRRPNVTVRALDSRPTPGAGELEQLSLNLNTSDSVVAEACAGVDAIIHLAGANEVEADREPDQALTQTLGGTERLARIASGTGVRRVVFLSTIHVYGAQARPGAELTESVAPLPRSRYAIARLASEHLLALAESEGVDVTVFRLSNAVGAPAHATIRRWKLVANDLCRQAVTTGELRLNSPGTQWRDFVPLRDVVRLLAGAATSAIVPPTTYNLSSGVPRTIRDLASLVQDAAEAEGLARPALLAPDPPSDAPAPAVISNRRLADAGWTPTTTLSSAVSETLQWCLSHRSELDAGPME